LRLFLSDEDRSVELKEVQRHWHTFGKIDPLWAIVSHPDKRYGKWKRDEFFASGEGEIDRILRHVDSLAFPLRRGRALDFGCGVGRLTQALARRFRQCDGVDIARSMVKLARKYDRPARRLWYETARLVNALSSGQYRWADCRPGFARLLQGHNCRYVVNTSKDLALFSDDTFDFVYSSLVLQHMRPEYSKNYIKEFLRVLAPGGLAVFQIPSRYMPEQELLYKARIRVGLSSLTVKPGARITLPVRVKNVSSSIWPAINLGNHWLSATGEMLVNDDGRARLPAAMGPEQEVEVSISVNAPRKVGHYWLELDLVQEGFAWFQMLGSETTRIPCQVQSGGRGFSLICHGVQQRIQSSRGYRATAQLYRRLLWRVRTKHLPGGFEPVMEMYGVPKDALVKWIEHHGGKIVDIQVDYSAGKDWESFRYHVTKP
jgi:SAM-dependent methyltransferase